MRGPEERLLRKVIEAVDAVHAETGLEVACSLGLLTKEQAERLAAAGVRRYNHNLETCREVFPSICTTHTYDDRVATARLAVDAGMELCCGGILGMGETLEQRIDFAFELAELDPCEVPINLLDPRPGTPLEDTALLSPREALQAIALFRLVLPGAWLRLAGGRERVLGELQAMGLLAGANALIVGNYLTTTGRAAPTTTRCSTRSACRWPTARAKAASSSTATARTPAPRSRRGSRCASTEPSYGRSLKPSSTGPSGPAPMRVIDATSRRMRHASSGPRPSAQITAALIGDTWLTATITPVPARSISSAVHSSMRPADAEALAARRREVGVGAPAEHPLGWCVGDRQLVPLAVVDLDQPLVDRDRAAGALGDDRRRLARPEQRARHDLRDLAVGEHLGRGAAPAPSRSRSAAGRPGRAGALPGWRRSRRGARRRSRRRRPREPAGAHELRARLREVEVELPDDHQHATRPTSSEQHDDPPAGSSGSASSSVPGTGHQNKSLDANAPESTSPQNTPIGRHSRRRRSSRGRPIVSTITTTSSATGNTSVCPYAR